MTKHVVVIASLYALACGSPHPQHDAGSPPMPLELKADDIVVVARGQSATLHVTAVAQLGRAQDALVAIGTLPFGVTATSATWHATDPQPLDLVISAATDAPTTEIGADVRAWVNGVEVGKVTTTIDVSSTEGSLDDTFGVDGVVELPSKTVGAAIAQASDGSFTVGGAVLDAPTRTFVARVSAQGVASAPVFAPLPFPDPSLDVFAAAIAPDGRVAVGVSMDNGTSAAVQVMDAKGQPLWAQSTGRMPCCLAWDGDGVFVADDGALLRVDQTNVTLTATGITPQALLVVAPGTALVGGESSANAATVAKCIAGATTPAATWTLTPYVPNLYALGLDASSDVLVGTATSIQRYLPSGSLVTTFPQIPSPVSAVPRIFLSDSSGSTYAIGVVDSYTNRFIAKFDASDALAADFGTLGRAITNLPIVAATLDDAQARICATGTSPETAHAFVACYRR